MELVPRPSPSVPPGASSPAPGGPPAGAPPVGEGLDLDRVTAELAAVEAALARLDDGRYGLCAACDSAIPDDLLVADPTATTCPAHLPI